MKKEATNNSWSCPVPGQPDQKIVIAHGGGGRLMHQLIDRVCRGQFDSGDNNVWHDGAVVNISTSRLAFTTDSYVVRPLFFPGGNIGSLAVFGTVNDLAMCGAKPLGISCAFIIEEGFDIGELEKITASMQQAAETVGTAIITGDTKVVDRGKGDGLYINTAGIGLIECENNINPGMINSGDTIILSGDIGRHGIAVMAAREGLQFETPLESDCASLWSPVKTLLDDGIDIHCLRDLTRGGLGSALVEIAEAAGHDLVIEEQAVAVSPAVAGACEILGFDPLFVANEGRFVAFIPRYQAEQALKILRENEVCNGSSIIGSVTGPGNGKVVLQTVIGSERIIDMPSGEQLPRIC